MQLSLVALASVLMTMASAASTPDSSVNIAKRATFPIPASKGSVTYKEPKIIKAGQPFDGLGKTYGRGVKCTGQDEVGCPATFVLVLVDLTDEISLPFVAGWRRRCRLYSRKRCRLEERHHRCRPDRGCSLRGCLYHPERLVAQRL